MKLRLLLAVLLSFWTANVYAYIELIRDGEVFLGSASYLLDSDKDLENPFFSIEAGFERPLDDRWSWELWFSRYKSDSEAVDAKSFTKRLYQGGLYHLNEGNFRTFVRAGFAHEKVNRLSGRERGGIDILSWPKREDTSFDLGVGFKKYLKSRFLWRGEVFSIYNFDREHFDLAARISLGYTFGRKYIREVKLPEPEPEPIPEPEPEPEPIDSDMDGVYDDKDQCPNTDMRFKVDEVGCPIMLTESISIEMDVKFLTGSADLSYDYYPEIEKVAQFMTKYEQTVLTVEGHTDYVGSAEYNRDLSQRRADSVRNALIVEFGLSEDRVVAIGYGEDRPIADNTTPEGRAKNRRVVAVIESSYEKAMER